MGGSGERRTLLTTAKYAQHWNFVGGSPEEFAHKVEVLHGHCADVGRDPGEITLSSHVWLSSGSDEHLADTREKERDLDLGREAGGQAGVEFVDDPTLIFLRTGVAHRLVEHQQQPGRWIKRLTIDAHVLMRVDHAWGDDLCYRQVRMALYR